MKKIDMKDMPAIPAPSSASGKKTAGNKARGNSTSRKVLVEQFDLHNSPGHLLRRCHSRARAIFDDLVGRATGLSKQQVALMVTISHIPAATHAQLSEETGFDRNTLADTIDRLIAKGLAVRERSTRDARAYEIHLTDEGQAQLEDLIPLSVEVQQKIMEPIPEASRQHFVECLQILAGVSESDLALSVSNAPKQSARRAATAKSGTAVRATKEIKPASAVQRSGKTNRKELK
jgi:DNA-binding MarR family transcriptional regulator